MGRTVSWGCIVLLCVAVRLACGQTIQATPSAPATSASSLAAQYATVLSGGSTIADATISGTATRISGSDRQTGSFTAKARGEGEGRIDLSLDGRSRSEIHNASVSPSCVRVESDGIAKSEGLVNCWTDPSWFFPALTSIAFTSDTTIAFQNLGQEQRYGTTVQHLQSSRTAQSGTPTAIKAASTLSVVDYYFDVASNLPVAIAFKFHPAGDTNRSIPVEVRFSGYQPVSGVQVPFHVQRFENGVLALDLVLSAAQFNTGLQDTDFIAQ